MILRLARHRFPAHPHRIVDLKDFDFAWEGLATLVGPSGSGKTTLFRLLCGWYDSDDTTCLFEPPLDRYRSVRFIGAHDGLLPWRTVFSNFSYRGIRCGDAEPMLQQVGLDKDVGLSPVYELSFGMYKRVELAIAIAESPTLLLLDEFFSSIDDATKTAVRDYILRSRPSALTWIIAHEESLRRWLSPIEYSLEIEQGTRCVIGIQRS